MAKRISMATLKAFGFFAAVCAQLLSSAGAVEKSPSVFTSASTMQARSSTELGDRLAVDVALVLAVDVSYSVDGQEFGLQLNGLVEAFRSNAVINAIQAGERGAITVSVIQWSNRSRQQVILPWTRIGSELDSLAFADRLSRTGRPVAPGGTSIAGAIEFGIGLHRLCACIPDRRVIDISADGRDSYEYRVSAARTLAAANGITVNGLAILNEVPTLAYYFSQNVITGQMAFVEEADDYSDFARAIQRKILREIMPPMLSMKSIRHALVGDRSDHYSPPMPQALMLPDVR